MFPRCAWQNVKMSANNKINDPSPHAESIFYVYYDNIVFDGLSLCHLYENIQQNSDVWRIKIMLTLYSPSLIGQKTCLLPSWSKRNIKFNKANHPVCSPEQFSVYTLKLGNTSQSKNETQDTKASTNLLYQPLWTLVIPLVELALFQW